MGRKTTVILAVFCGTRHLLGTKNIYVLNKVCMAKLLWNCALSAYNKKKLFSCHPMQGCCTMWAVSLEVLAIELWFHVPTPPISRHTPAELYSFAAPAQRMGCATGGAGH
eukprot:1154832-Pelagomonas_calceolata.AAC.4